MKRYALLAVLMTVIALMAACRSATPAGEVISAPETPTQPTEPVEVQGEPVEVPGEPVEPPEEVVEPPAGGGGPSPPSNAFPPGDYAGITRVYLAANAVGASSSRQSNIGPLMRSAVASSRDVVEGHSFRVRVSFDGARPSEGSCDLLASDSQTGVTDTARAWANGEDVSTLFTAEHTNDADDGRTIRVTITDCDFPDLDRQRIEYRIGANGIDVAVLTAGPVETDPNAYAVTVGNLRWDESGLDWHLNSSYFLYRFDWTISPAAPIDLSLAVSHHDGAPEDPESVNYVRIPAGKTSGTEGYTAAKTAPGTQRTVTIQATDIRPQVTLGDPTPPPVAYTLNTELISATMTVFAWVLPDTTVEFVSLTGPATDGGTITANLTAADRPSSEPPTNAPGLSIYFRVSDNWIARGGSFLGDYRTWPSAAGNARAFPITIPTCCSPHGTAPHQSRFLPADQRPSPRVITVEAIYKSSSATKTIEVQP